VKANDHQIGGQHYKTAYEHWDLVIATGMGYFPAQATRYTVRWRKKDGLKDLQKALHYIDKLREAWHDCATAGAVAPRPRPNAFAEVMKFSVINGLSEREQIAVAELATWQHDGDLVNARDMVTALIEHEAESSPVPVSDSNKHAERASPLNESEKLGHDGPRQIDRTGW